MQAGGCEDERALAEELGSITVARDAARRTLTEGAYLGNQEDVLLVVTELVTNALLHGGGPLTLRLSVHPSRVRVEVGDAGEELPEPREPGPADGWGLHVVGRLCTDWGVSPQPGGKVVWCELSPQPATVPAAGPGAVT
ncbi:hypothetical protein Misp01_23010 [Microtetraspora sp. NBRC 13810]|nr:hypothetical protein Misp01_23010 [Microtetraspora sp. NBRC 13810]